MYIGFGIRYHAAVKPKPIYTFRCPEGICNSINNLMELRNLDRSSVIKLALYMLLSYMAREDVQMMDLYSLVRSMEKQAPPGFPDFATFADS